MSMPTSDLWNVRFQRKTYEWGQEFIEHWTFKVKEGSVYYKLRVVGPQGEVFREDDMDKNGVPEGVRNGFEHALREAYKKA